MVDWNGNEPKFFEMAASGQLAELAGFLHQEFPEAVVRTDGDERIIDTAMMFLSEMKQTLEANGFKPEGGW